METRTAIRTCAGRLQHIPDIGAFDVELHLQGEGGGTFTVTSSAEGISVDERSLGRGAKLQVVGDARRFIAVLDGRKSMRHMLYTGAFTVRGDTQLSMRLARALGLLAT